MFSITCVLIKVNRQHLLLIMGHGGLLKWSISALACVVEKSARDIQLQHDYHFVLKETL